MSLELRPLTTSVDVVYGVTLLAIMSTRLLVQAVQANETLRLCPDGLFRPEVGDYCRPCSGCPDNEVVRETCSGSRDTVCGPFTEFQIFQSHRGHHDSTSQAGDHVDEGGSGSLYAVSVVMTVLLAVTSIICIIMGALICYRRLQDKKEGLMIYVDKDSDQASCADWLENHACRRRSSSINGSDVNHVMQEPRPCSSHMRQFEIGEPGPSAEKQSTSRPTSSHVYQAEAGSSSGKISRPSSSHKQFENAEKGEFNVAKSSPKSRPVSSHVHQFEIEEPGTSKQ